MLTDDHYTITSSRDISEICKPLLRIGITNFDYEKIYFDGSKVKLTTSPEWILHYYNRGFYLRGDFEKHIESFSSEYKLWSTLNSQDIFQEAKIYFNIDNGVVLSEKHEKYCEFFWFGSDPENITIVNLYLTNIELLNRFVVYFKEKATKIIEQAEKNKLTVPAEKIIKHTMKVIDVSCVSGQIDEFIKETSIDRFRLSGQLDDIVITGKELEVAICLLEGKTMKEAAKKLSVSPRTIETHMVNLKDKTLSATKSRLINVLLNNGLGIYKFNK